MIMLEISVLSFGLHIIVYRHETCHDSFYFVVSYFGFMMYWRDSFCHDVGDGFVVYFEP